jgi:hypothetical protein
MLTTRLINKSGCKKTVSSIERNLLSLVEQTFWQRNMSKQRGSGSERPITICTSNFISSMHNNCRAAAYKVHLPGCSCSKVQQIKSRWNETETSTAAQLDGLLVLPDTKVISAVYVCPDTGREIFEKDPLATETNLANQLFSSNETQSQFHSLSPLKVKCAQCLLAREPNGFVCIISSSKVDLLRIRDLALESSSRRSAQGIPLHADHAQDVAVVSKTVLQAMASAKTRAQISQATANLVAELKDQGIIDCDQYYRYDLGHHVEALLRISAYQKNQSDSLEYWFIMIQASSSKQESSRKTIDLPGGKRHLGEASLAGAIRETYEETSLSVDSTWLVGSPRRGSRNEAGNIYFIMQPPPSPGTLIPEREKKEGKDDCVREVTEMTSQLNLR